ncbi:hypothetical protein GCM10010302_09560 [Streptomyces polychromogenes]|uniref:HEAT repeat domain-containing protein n=2 Tax=Streptomyces polychromogenes TaxID=67342 RepID=A0ABN0V403_9ACTN
MAGTDRGEGSAERAALRRALEELDARLAAGAERGPGACVRFDSLVEKLRTPAAAFLKPELEERLARHVAADDSFARDRMAHVLAGACGQEALPALLRAMVTDRNEDGDMLHVDVLDLFEAWPDTAFALSMEYTVSDDPGLRRVGLWGVCFFDSLGTEYFGLVADAACDPDPGVRADVMTTLGSSVGLGDPSRALDILIAGASDAAPEVRRAVVSALYGAREAAALSGRPAPDARAALERLATDEEATVRDAARRALAPATGWF